MIEIYNSAGVLQCSFPSVLSASLCDKLSGERTLSFSVLASRSQPLSVGMTAKLDGQFYNIVRVSKRITGGFPVTTVLCEHITYTLNDEKYNLETFVFSGTPTAGMAKLLSGTPFSVGVIEATGRVECNVGGQGSLNRRNVLMQFIGTCGCEVEYDGYKINLRKHRGSTERKSLMDGENVTDLAVTIDSREDTQSYQISLFKMTDLAAGDEVNITYTPMGVNADTRIIGIEYDPFCRYTVRVEVGTYVPDILDNLQSASEKAEAALKTAQDTAESLSEYAKKSDVSASIDTYINSEAGQASIVASLSGAYVTTEDLTGYALKTELSAEIGAYIDTQAGTAKIVNNLSGTFVKSDALGDFVEKTELATEIGSYIDTQAGTAKIISAASGTFQKKSDMGSYVTTTTLNTSVAQYIDSAAGKAKIISACSGTYVTGSDLAGYAKASALTTIEQSVSDVVWRRRSRCPRPTAKARSGRMSTRSCSWCPMQTAAASRSRRTRSTLPGLPPLSRHRIWGQAARPPLTAAASRPGKYRQTGSKPYRFTRTRYTAPGRTAAKSCSPPRAYTCMSAASQQARRLPTPTSWRRTRSS